MTMTEFTALRKCVYELADYAEATRKMVLEQTKRLDELARAWKGVHDRDQKQMEQLIENLAALSDNNTNGLAERVDALEQLQKVSDVETPTPPVGQGTH